MKQGIIRFEDIELDHARGELRRADRRVEIEPQVFALLSYLAGNAGRLITRDELIDGVWAGRIVSESAITTRIAAARQAVGDDGRAQRIIRTVPRKGVMFLPTPDILPTSEHDLAGPGDPEPASGQPLVVVLPFRSLSDNANDDVFAEGIAEDIMTALAAFEEIAVIAQESATRFLTSREDAIAFSKSLNVDYFLEGAVQRSGNRVRISVRLANAENGTAVWSKRFDRAATDLFEVQDQVSGAVANALVGEVSNRRVAVLASRAPRQLRAYDHALKAQKHIWIVSKADCAIARLEAEAAIALEPDYARAHALLSWATLTEDGNGWGESGSQQYAKAVAHARIAVALDGRNPWAHAMLGVSMFWRRENLPEADAHLDHAVRLSPSHAHIRMLRGAQLAYGGEGQKAVEQLDLAISLNPLSPELYLLHRARGNFVAGRLEAALADAARAAAGLPRHPTAWAMLAACRASLGQLAEAGEAKTKILETSPDFTLRFARQSYPFQVPDHLDRFCACLKDAGLPESLSGP